MKKNPCFLCICKPICRNKFWATAVLECSKLNKAVCTPINNKSALDWDIVETIDSKKIFDIKFLE